MNSRQIFALALGVGMVAPIIAAPVMRHAPQAAELRDWTRGIEHDDHRLIGFACGPDRLTMTAAEEDHFPTCGAIEAIADVCPPDPAFPALMDEPVTARECASYMGDGW